MDSKRARNREPFQFNMATLLAIVTAYAVLFGVLRWMQVTSVAVFAAIVIYLTALAYAQWALFDGQHPYRASFLMSGILGVAATLADGLPKRMEVLSALPIAFLVGAMAGGVFGGFVDITLLLIQIVGGFNRNLMIPTMRLPSTASPDAPRAKDHPRGRKIHRLMLLVLVILFFLAVLMIRFEQ